MYQPPSTLRRSAEPAATTVTSMQWPPLAVAQWCSRRPVVVVTPSCGADVDSRAAMSAPVAASSWSADAGSRPQLGTGAGTEAQKLLAGGQFEVWDALTRRFESRLIRNGPGGHPRPPHGPRSAWASAQHHHPQDQELPGCAGTKRENGGRRMLIMPLQLLK